MRDEAPKQKRPPALQTRSGPSSRYSDKVASLTERRRGVGGWGMPLSGLTKSTYVAIVQSTGVTALTFSASRFDLDQCAPLKESEQEAP
jgi:hypothetical protein